MIPAFVLRYFAYGKRRPLATIFFYSHTNSKEVFQRGIFIDCTPRSKHKSASTSHINSLTDMWIKLSVIYTIKILFFVDSAN